MPPEEPTVGHLVVTDRSGPLHGDPVAVRHDRVERLERQSGRTQGLDRPGDDADIVEPSLQGHLGEIARLAGMAADHRIGADDDHESALDGSRIGVIVVDLPGRVGGPTGRRTRWSSPTARASGPRSICRQPQLSQLVTGQPRPVESTPSSAHRLHVLHRGRSAVGSTKPVVSIVSGDAPDVELDVLERRRVHEHHVSARRPGTTRSTPTRTRKLSPPESSLPGSPPRPTPNWLFTAACTISAVRSGRPT